LSGLRITQMCLIRSPATSNANTVTVTPSLLSHQPGLAVDRTLQERRLAGCPAGDFDPGARDLLAAFDGAQEGNGEAAAVGDRRGVGVEEADQGVDVLRFPGLLEGPDDVGLPGWGGRGGLRGADAAAGRGGQLAAGRRGTADDLGHLGEGVAEHIVQDERDALAGVIDSSTTRKAMLTDSSRVTRSAGSAVVPPGRPLIHSVRSGSGSGIHSPT
jgi:hypothetical protein